MVPKIEMPPRIPSRGFRVWRASSSPRGTKISTPRRRGWPGKTWSHTRSETAADHPPGHRVDGRLAHRQGQPGFGHPADPGTAMEFDLCFGPATVQPPDPGADLGAVGDVRVVAGVLDHRGLAPRPVASMIMQRDGQAAAAGQGNLHLLGAGQIQQLPQGPLGRGRGRGAGGEALAQLLPGAGRLFQV